MLKLNNRNMEDLIYLPKIKGLVAKRGLQLKWRVNNLTLVKKGDLLLEMVIPSIGLTNPVLSPRDGIVVKIIRESAEIKHFHPTTVKVVVCGIYDSFEDYIDCCYKFKAIVTLDSFTNQKIINWEFVAKHELKIYDDKRYIDIKDLGFLKESLYAKTNRLQLNSYPSPGFFFSLVYEEGEGMIVFSYNPYTIKIKKNDTISLLFDDGGLIDFKILIKPYKVNETQNFMNVKCRLFLEDIKQLMNKKISKWRISFNESGKPAIIGDVCGFNESGNSKWVKDFTKIKPYLIQKYVKEYINVLQQECPNYELPRKTRPFETTGNYYEMFDWCYVYLMKDLSNGYYKIGISNKPEYREHTLQSEKPTIEMIGCKKYPSRRIAEAFEKALHQAFSERHIRGEWFSLNGYEVATLLETLK